MGAYYLHKSNWKEINSDRADIESWHQFAAVGYIPHVICLEMYTYVVKPNVFNACAITKNMFLI